MEIIRMKLAELKKPKKNVRMHTEKQLQEYERSVRKFGQIRPIIVDENKTILACIGLYETLCRMNIDEADVYQIKNLSEAQKKKLMITDNKIFSLGIDNLEVLNEFFEELKDDLDIPGFDEEILKQMVAEADEVTDKLSEYGILDDEEIENIKENAERKEQKMHKIDTMQEEQQQAPQQFEHVPVPPIQRAEADEDKSTAEIGKFVVCPKCGEKIWL